VFDTSKHLQRQIITEGTHVLGVSVILFLLKNIVV